MIAAAGDALPTRAAIIADLVARGRDAWPELAVDDTRFAAHVAARFLDGAALHVEDLYLACACSDGDARALAIFDARHLASVPRYLRRLDRSPAFADDVRQRLREHLFFGSDGEHPRIASYSGRGPLDTWVKIAAIRLALNIKRDGHELDLGRADEPHVSVSPELQLLRRRHRADLQAAFADAVAALSSDERELLRLHFLEALPLGRIAALQGVDKSTVWRRLQLARATLFAETSAGLRDRLRIASDEAPSLIRLLFHDLADVSVARLLRAHDAH